MLPLPAPTTNLEQAKQDLRESGVCLMPNAISTETLQRAHEAIYRAATDDRTRGVEQTGFALDQDNNNQRIWNLLNRDPVFCDLAEHPTALALVEYVIGWPALLSNISGNIAGPGATGGVIHADQIFVPQPWPDQPQGINIAWCIDDFTIENGATQVVPGSHRLNRLPEPDEAEPLMVSVEAPAGSIFAFESRIWHRTGANISKNKHRAAVFPFYTTPVYRTQENWFLSLNPAVRRFASDTLLTLLAYKTSGFGLVYGQSPE